MAMYAVQHSSLSLSLSRTVMCESRVKSILLIEPFYDSMLAAAIFFVQVHKKSKTSRVMNW